MMNKELCFIIEEQQLFMEKILVDYDGIPIFYLCNSLEGMYLVLRRSLDDELYVIVKPGLQNILDMLKGRLGMREIITNQNEFWDVAAGDDIYDDVVIKRSMREIPADDLPYKDSYYKLATTEMEGYVKDLDNKLFESATWEKVNTVSLDNMPENCLIKIMK